MGGGHCLRHQDAVLVPSLEKLGAGALGDATAAEAPLLARAMHLLVSCLEVRVWCNDFAAILDVAAFFRNVVVCSVPFWKARE